MQRLILKDNAQQQSFVDSLMIRNISDDIILFLDYNGLIEKDEYIIGNIFPRIYSQAQELPKALLPKKLQNDKNYKKETKRIKKKLSVGFRCVNF